jgi:hypothetical protein
MVLSCDDFNRPIPLGHFSAKRIGVLKLELVSSDRLGNYVRATVYVRAIFAEKIKEIVLTLAGDDLNETIFSRNAPQRKESL